MTRLPLSLEPLPDESWPSYLNRRAAQHQITLADLGDHLDLRGKRGSWPGRFGVTLTPEQTRHVAPILGLVEEQVARMQLATYDQLAFDLAGLNETTGIAATRATSHAAWVWLAGSTFCPTCLAEDGAWRLKWRIPWIATCQHHQTPLMGVCPSCGGVPGLGNRFHGSAPARVAAVPDGRLCPCPLKGGGVCAAPLHTRPPRAARAERVARTRTMTALVEGQRREVAGTSYTSLQTLRAWQTAIGIAVRLGVVETGGWGRTHRWANPPRDPDLIDRLLATVQPLIEAPEPAAAADELGRWCRRAGITTPHADTFARISQPSTALQPVVDELLSRRGRATTLIQRRLVHPDGTPLDGVRWNINDIPQLVWPCALPEHLRSSTRPEQRLLRAVVAMTLVRMCTHMPDWAHAGRLLGFPSDKARNWARHAFNAHWGLKADLLSSAERLGRCLDQQPQRGAWAGRGLIAGYGVGALTLAQAPSCHHLDSGWCPCHLS